MVGICTPTLQRVFILILIDAKVITEHKVAGTDIMTKAGCIKANVRIPFLEPAL